FNQLMSRPIDRRPENPVKVGLLEDLSFENVVFRHKTAATNAIDGISFKVKTGETIAFVGPSGSGKSTLVKLLLGLYKPVKGKICYNRHLSEEIRYNELRRQIGFVSQDTQLFAGTIKENLLFVKSDASDSEIMEALKQASCEKLINNSPKGVDTLLGEGGMKLSGGEKQRISIARAILRQPRLLIFDEATSSLDSITEVEITDTIRNFSGSREQITILIAHRLATVMHADVIYVLEKGKITETGSHEKLIEQKGLYYAMWRQQIGERRNTIRTTSV
ncbi:MAG: ATP-binding cassette domain-containing protein, partial [Bacteroidales bacterium]|nr:ATP-binding cassette domain-containing protein [Bacteroidales bacterium]